MCILFLESNFHYKGLNADMNEMEDSSRIAMSSQQKRFTSSNKSPLQLYRELTVGNKGLGYFTSYELYTLLCSNIPGLIGMGLRRAILPKLFAECGSGLAVGRGVSIRQPQLMKLGEKILIDDYAALDIRTTEDSDQKSEISIGSHALIGRYTVVVAKNGTIRLGDACNISSHCRLGIQGSELIIGNSVLIAAYAYIGPGNHKIEGTSPIIEQNMDIKSGVRIGNNVWVGARATILDGVTIGDDAVIGAHSLVVEDVPPRAIAVGVPAKVIRYRD